MCIPIIISDVIISGMAIIMVIDTLHQDHMEVMEQVVIQKTSIIEVLILI